MKKIICILLALMMLALTACTGNDESSVPGDPSVSGDESSVSGDVAASSAPESGDGSSTENSDAVEPDTFNINGHTLDEYRIVYRHTGLTARYSTAAYELRDVIAEKFGVTLDVVPENESLPARETEFLVGMCIGRELCDDYYYEIYEERGDNFLVVSGGTVLFAAGTPNGAHFAIREFASIMDEEITVTDMKKQGEGKVINVACVGDSITQGINSEDKNKTYPIFLQEMLGLDYYVMNYGLSGYSIVNTDEYAYRKSAEYSRSLAFMPDVVIFALGTNDCNPTDSQPYKAWEGTDRADKFIASTKELLDSYIALPTKPKIYVCLPCSLVKVPGDWWNAEAWTERVEKYALPLLKQIAEEYGLPTIDLWTWSKAHPELFPDGLHPKDDTYKDFAQAIYDGIIDTVAG